MLLPPSRALPIRRLFSTSTRRRDLVGPPDPVSHLRPVIYDDVVPTTSATQQSNSPYSLREFGGTGRQFTGDYELQWKLHRQQLDAFDQRFWSDSNTRFEAGKAAVLSALPVSNTTPIDKERALSEFYKQWILQEQPHTETYTKEWRRRNWESVFLGTHVMYHRLLDKLPFARA